jgi:hypothetical protein
VDFAIGKSSLKHHPNDSSNIILLQLLWPCQKVSPGQEEKYRKIREKKDPSEVPAWAHGLYSVGSAMLYKLSPHINQWGLSQFNPRQLGLYKWYNYPMS